MIVEQVWTGNNYRNFNYLIACGETGEAMAIDPLDHQKCLAKAEEMGWEITQVLNTHEHGDHIGGNKDVIAATGASEFHASASGSRESGMEFRNPRCAMGDDGGEYTLRVTDEERVRELAEILARVS